MLADPKLMRFFLMLGIPVAACSSQVFGPFPLSLMHCTLQLPHLGMTPVELMLHLLNSSTAGIYSADANLMHMHIWCLGIPCSCILSAHVQSVLILTRCSCILSAQVDSVLMLSQGRAYSVPMPCILKVNVPSGPEHTQCPCILNAKAYSVFRHTQCSSICSAHAYVVLTPTQCSRILSAKAYSVTKLAQ